MKDRPALTKKLEKLIKPPGFTGKAPGGLSRWSTKHSMEWQPLDPKLVVEVQFDHFTGGRFRHGTGILTMAPGKSTETMHHGAGETRKPVGARPVVEKNSIHADVGNRRD